MDSLTQLEQRLAGIQQELSQTRLAPMATYQQPIPQESLEEKINRLIDEKLNKLAQSAMPPTQEQAAMGYGQALLCAVGSALNESQQLWLSEESNRKDIPAFLQSIEGQAITRRFFNSYKSFLESKS